MQTFSIYRILSSTNQKEIGQFHLPSLENLYEVQFIVEKHVLKISLIIYIKCL